MAHVSQMTSLTSLNIAGLPPFPTTAAWACSAAPLTPRHGLPNPDPLHLSPHLLHPCFRHCRRAFECANLTCSRVPILRSFAVYITPSVAGAEIGQYVQGIQRGESRRGHVTLWANAEVSLSC